MQVWDKQFHDIRMTEDFIDDYITAPERIQERFDTILRIIMSSNKVPNSAHAHPADALSKMWIGYVTVSRPLWRFLFTWDENDVLVLMRLVNHNQQDLILHFSTPEERKVMVEAVL